MNTLGNFSRTIFWGAIAWIIAAGFLALQFWPVVSHTARGWVAFLVVGPPLWFLSESASERLWATRTGRAISNHPSSAFRIFIGVMLGAITLATWLGLSWFFGFEI